MTDRDLSDRAKAVAGCLIILLEAARAMIKTVAPIPPDFRHLDEVLESWIRLLRDDRWC